MTPTWNDVVATAGNEATVLITLDAGDLAWLEQEYAPKRPAAHAGTSTTTDIVPAVSAVVHNGADRGIDEPTNWAEAAAQRVNTLALLPENWDGLDGLPPGPGVVATVGMLLERLQDTVVSLEAPTVLPLPNGSIQFEWTSAGRHVEFRVVNAGCILCLREEEEPGGVEIEVNEIGTDDAGINSIRELLRWLGAECRKR